METDKVISGILNCEHLNVLDTGECRDCGINLYKFGPISTDCNHLDNYNNSVIKKMDFEKDIKPLETVCEEVKRWVVNKATLAPKSICRITKRKERLFSYICLGYLYLGQETDKSKYIDDFNPLEIAAELKLSKPSIGEVIKTIGAISSKPLPQLKNDSMSVKLAILRPKKFIKKHLLTLDKMEYYDDICTLCEDLENIDIFILEENCITMSIMIIVFYLQKINQCPKFITTHIFKVSPVNVKLCLELIENAYNKLIENNKTYF